MKKETVICNDIHGNTHKVPTNELTFRPSVYGIIIKDNKVLLSPQFGDGYDIPGGSVDLGEGLHDALIREVFEETGIQTTPIKVLHISDDFFTHPNSGKHFHTILIYYLCEYVSGEITTDSFTESEKQYMGKAEWVPLSKIDTLKFYNPIDSPKVIRKAMS